MQWHNNGDYKYQQMPHHSGGGLFFLGGFMTKDEAMVQMKILIDQYAATNRALVCELYNSLLDVPKPDEEEQTQLDLFE